MVTWEMADGSEIRYEGVGVEPAALREFVLRFMSAQRNFWDATHWSEDALGVAFEKRFAQSVNVRREQRTDGSWQFVIRPRLAFA
jgi:predicted acetyltransferase